MQLPSSELMAWWGGLELTLMMATAVFAETVENLQHSTQCISQSQSHTLSTGH
jgi:hypothetical protein